MVAYIFPGQGTQYPGMGKELYDTYPEAKEVFDAASKILKFDVPKLCFEGTKEELVITANCSVAIVVHSLAALKAFEPTAISQNMQPKFMLGLSLGEYSALAAAGVLSIEDCIYLVRKRGEYMDMAAEKNPGKMVSILGMPLEQVEELCKGIGGCEVANLNCPNQVVVSGKAANIELLAGLAKDKGAKRAILLDVAGAFHSSLMTPAKEKLEKEIEKLTFNIPNIPIISNVNGESSRDPEVIKRNLIAQINTKTMFEASIRNAMAQGVKNFFEIGPGTVLRGILRKIDKSLQVTNIEKPEHLKALVQKS